jgi:cysteine desulfurase
MTKKSNKTTYLDYASGTPIDREVQNLISKTESVFYANPSSIHRGGLKAKKLIDDSRARIASLLYAHRDEIIFTGSGTESIALAILGLVSSFVGKGKPHIITSEIEHPVVLENCKMLEKNGKATVTYIPVDEKGFINPKLIRENIKGNTVLVSIMYANNEIGTIQNIEEIAKQVRHYRKNNSSALPYFHTDACQAMNYLFTENVEKLGVDLMTFNSSKIYGPKGIACLYKKRNVEISPLYYGGGQEYGLRSGTESVSLIASFSLAFEKSIKMKKKESARLLKLRDYAIKKLLMLSKNSGYKIIINGDTENRLPNNINISVDEIKSELLVIELDAKGIEVSSKSACKSDEPDESYVISALRKAQGLKGDSTTGSLRITLGRDTKKEDLDFLVKTLGQILSKYKKWKVS